MVESHLHIIEEPETFVGFSKLQEQNQAFDTKHVTHMSNCRRADTMGCALSSLSRPKACKYLPAPTCPKKTAPPKKLQRSLRAHAAQEERAFVLRRGKAFVTLREGACWLPGPASVRCQTPGEGCRKEPRSRLLLTSTTAQNSALSSLSLSPCRPLSLSLSIAILLLLSLLLRFSFCLFSIAQCIPPFHSSLGPLREAAPTAVAAAHPTSHRSVQHKTKSMEGSRKNQQNPRAMYDQCVLDPLMWAVRLCGCSFRCLHCRGIRLSRFRVWGLRL